MHQLIMLKKVLKQRVYHQPETCLAFNISQSMNLLKHFYKASVSKNLNLSSLTSVFLPYYMCAKAVKFAKKLNYLKRKSPSQICPVWKIYIGVHKQHDIQTRSFHYLLNETMKA